MSNRPNLTDLENSIIKHRRPIWQTKLGRLSIAAVTAAAFGALGYEGTGMMHDYMTVGESTVDPARQMLQYMTGGMLAVVAGAFAAFSSGVASESEKGRKGQISSTFKKHLYQLGNMRSAMTEAFLNAEHDASEGEMNLKRRAAAIFQPDSVLQQYLTPVEFSHAVRDQICFMWLDDPKHSKAKDLDLKIFKLYNFPDDGDELLNLRDEVIQDTNSILSIVNIDMQGTYFSGLAKGNDYNAFFYHKSQLVSQLRQVGTLGKVLGGKDPVVALQEKSLKTVQEGLDISKKVQGRLNRPRQANPTYRF